MKANLKALLEAGRYSPEQRKRVVSIIMARSRQGYTNDVIALELNNRGLETASGKSFTGKSVRNYKYIENKKRKSCGVALAPLAKEKKLPPDLSDVEKARATIEKMHLLEYRQTDIVKVLKEKGLVHPRTLRPWNAHQVSRVIAEAPQPERKTPTPPIKKSLPDTSKSTGIFGEIEAIMKIDALSPDLKAAVIKAFLEKEGAGRKDIGL